MKPNCVSAHKWRSEVYPSIPSPIQGLQSAFRCCGSNEQARRPYLDIKILKSDPSAKLQQADPGRMHFRLP
jgi:hypothetical protein